MLGANSSVTVSCHTEQISTSSLSSSKPAAAEEGDEISKGQHMSFHRILSEDALGGGLSHSDYGIS